MLAIMLSQTTEYALRAVVFLAGRAPEPQTTGQIAGGTRVPTAYLSKVLQSLGRASIVRSRRGLHGGFSLARDPAALTILEVIRAVDPLRRIETCPLGLVSHGANLCPLHRRLDDALARIEEAFGHTTLAEILDEPSDSVPLCPFPRGGAAETPSTSREE